MTTTLETPTPNAPPAAPQAQPPSVASVAGLTKRYGAVAAVDSVSFDVPSGEVVGLLGPNGAGKTTVMKMLVGLVRPTSGRASLLGAGHDDAGFASAVRRVGALIEAPALYEQLSARRNLELQARTLGLGKATARVDDLLELVDLVDRADDKAGKYSLGMKQRLGIAIAMIGRPELVILDEPSNGLDPAGIVEIRELLRRLPQMGTTVLVSSHQLAEVEQACDRLLILAKGALIGSGTTSEILRAHAGHDFVVRLEPGDVPAVVQRLRHHQLMVQTEADRADSLVVGLPHGWTGRELNQLLVQAGVYACELVQQTPTLESAFLEMTGANHDHR